MVWIGYVCVARWTYQCKRNVCKNADRPSIMTRMPMVRPAQKAKITHKNMPPDQPFCTNACRNTMSHSTSANSVGLNDVLTKGNLTF